MKNTIPMFAAALLMASSLAFTGESSGQNKVVYDLSDTESLLITSTGTVTVEKVKRIKNTTIVTPGPIVKPDDPVTPNDPNTSLTEVVQKATADVPEYASKDIHTRTIATSISFMAPYMVGTGSTAEVQAMMKKLCDSAVGSDASFWSNWWTTVNAKTANLTIPQYKDALTEISNALVSDMAGASESISEEFGMKDYGLPPGTFLVLLKLLMQYLPQILALLN